MFNERGLKEAFDRIKEDIFNLSSEVSSIKNTAFELKQLISTINDELNTLKLKHLSLENTCNNQVLPTDNPTHTSLNSTAVDNPTDNPTVPHEIKGLKYPFSRFSTGNQGVPTDRQTNYSLIGTKVCRRDRQITFRLDFLKASGNFRNRPIIFHLLALSE